jgi:hypothetical protein
MHIYAPNPVVLSLPSVRTDVIEQRCACNVYQHHAYQDDWGVSKCGIQFRQKQPQNLDTVMIN